MADVMKTATRGCRGVRKRAQEEGGRSELAVGNTFLAVAVEHHGVDSSLERRSLHRNPPQTTSLSPPNLLRYLERMRASADPSRFRFAPAP